MKTTIQIKGFEIKAPAEGKRGYHKFDTSEGIINVFDKALIDPMVANAGKIVDIEMIEQNGFKNIKKFYGIGEANNVKVTEENVKPSENFAEARAMKDQSIYTSYAKDIVIAIWTKQEDKLMKEENKHSLEDITKVAINTVKQIKEAFK